MKTNKKDFKSSMKDKVNTSSNKTDLKNKAELPTYGSDISAASMTNKEQLLSPMQVEETQPMIDNPVSASNNKVALTTLDSYKEDAESKKNEKSDEITSELSQVVLSSGDTLKNKFNFGGMFDKLDSMGDIPLPDKLDTLMKSFINSQIDKFKQAASESAESAWRGIKNMAKAQVKKLLNVAISRIYLPDAVYLAGLIPLYGIGSNLRYYNDYARSKAIKADYNITLAWIDDQINFEYSIINNKNNTSANIRMAAKHSCIDVFDYMLEHLLQENKMVQRNIKSYQYQIDLVKVDIKEANKQIDRHEEEMNDRFTSEERKKYLQEVIKLEKKNIEEYEKKIKDIQKEKDPWDDYDHNYKNLVAESFKNLLVYGVGNFNQRKVKDYFSKYNVKPAWFGDTDPDFGGRHKFNESDVNTMAPFYNERGFIKDIKRDLGDTRLVKTSKLPKYITLRNVFLKYIYIQLNSINIYGEGNQLASKVLYERLKYQTMDHLTQMGDKFLGEMIEDGLGKMAVDTLLAIEKAIYDYTKKVERAFNDPLARDYYQLMSYGQELPPPIIPVKPNESFDQGYKRPNNDGFLEGNMKPDDLKLLLKYYFRFIGKELHYKIIANLFKDLLDKYNKTNDKDKDFYKEFIIRHFGELSLKSDFNPEEYFKNVSSDYLFNMYYAIFAEIYYEEYKKIIITDSYTKIDKFLYEEILLKHYTQLRYMFYDYQIDLMTSATIYQSLVFIYELILTKALNDARYNNLLITFLRKHYSDKACTPSFKLDKYLDSMNNDQRNTLLKNIIKDLDYNIFNDKNWSKLKLEIFDPIFTQIFPDFSIVIKVEQGKDIDIDDKEVIKDVENDFKDPYFIDYIRGFDDKIWKEGTASPGDDRNIELFIPEQYLDYVVFYNPELLSKENISK